MQRSEDSMRTLANHGLNRLAVGELTDGFTDGRLAVGAGWCTVEWEANMRARPESACSWKHLGDV